MTAPERRGPERPGPDYPPEWDTEPDECSNTCRRMVCEWCPEYDRQAQITEEFVGDMDRALGGSA